MSTENDAPINRLPNEILCDIFLANTAKDPDGENPYGPRITLVSSCLVCKRWEQVASNFPLLWSRIINFERDRLEWIEKLLRRSQSSPLEVGGDSIFRAVRLQNGRSKAILQSIFQHKARIKTLSLNIRIAPWEPICKHFLGSPAPNLESVFLTTACAFPDCLYEGDLFANEAPCLRKLHMQRCLTDFSSPVLHNLTQLSVYDILVPNIRAMSWRKPDHPLKVAPSVLGWLRILENMPSLRYLSLGHAISASTLGEDADLFRVDLPDLRFLTLNSAFTEASSLLEHLKVAPGCAIRARLTTRDAAPAAAGSKFLNFLGHQISHWAEAGPDRYLQAKLLDCDRIHFGNSKRVGLLWDMTEEEVIQEHQLGSADPLLWLVLSFNTSEDTLEFFNQLLSLYMPTYATTTNLDLGIDEQFTTANPELAVSPSIINLTPFVAVKTLNLLGQSPVTLLPHLEKISTPGEILLPSLRTLRVTRTRFNSDDMAPFLTIVAFLRWRNKVGAPLAEVEAIDSAISHRVVDDLEQAGGVKVTVR